MHGLSHVCFELEEKLFRHKIILVDDALHGDEEEITMWLRTHLYKVDCGIFAGKCEFIVVYLYSLEAFHANKWTVFLKVSLLSSLNRVSE